MNFHRSMIWRVSFAYAVIVIASLAALVLLLREATPEQSAADLETKKEEEARLAATLAASYLADTAEPPDPESLHHLSKTLSQWLDARVTIIALSGEALADSHWDAPAFDGDSSYDFTSDYDLLRARLGDVASSNRLTFHADYSQVLYTAAPITTDDEIVGVLRLRTPVYDAAPAIGGERMWFVVWGLAAGLLALAVIWLVARHSNRSSGYLQAMAEASDSLARGDFDHRVPSDGHEDTRSLTGAFNRMADTVKSVIDRLSSERDTLSAVLDTMADGVIVVEPTGQVSLLNPAARDLLEIREEAMTGARLVELVRDNEIHQVIAVCQTEKTRQQTEVSLHMPRRYLSAIATPLENNGGVLLTMHDLTRMRQVETSQKEFVSNVSHELRNPMASIKAMVETLESGAVNDSRIALDFLARMRGDVDRINVLVDGLLELSRMESGQFRIQAQPINIEPLVQRVRDKFSEAAAAQGVDLVTSINGDVSLVMGDGEMLTQVFVNLVENALKFTPRGGSISILAQPTGEFVRIEVKDTGVGVAPQHLPHIFERFYKVDRSRRDSGTGLGLAIVKQLVESHGGRISVESREGEGCAFVFTIPAAH